MTEMKDKIYPSLPDVRESLSAPAIELNEMGMTKAIYID